MLWPKFFPRIRWQVMLAPWQQVDWWLAAAALTLLILGGVMIRSTQLSQNSWTDWTQHWVTGAVGLVLAACLARMRYELLEPWKWVIYGIINLGLLSVMFFGQQELGAQRWINLFGFNVQPSEFAKLGIIIMLAALLQERPATTLMAMLRALGVVALPWMFVFLEPNLGTSLVFGAITMAMLYWGNANPAWLLLMLSPLLSALIFNTLLGWGWVFLVLWLVWIGFLGWLGWCHLPWARWGGGTVMGINLVASGLGEFLWHHVLRDYQRQRLTLFLNPEQDPTGGGYHLIQSRIAIGSGQFWGRGLHHGPQTQLNFVPEQHTDFIFAAVGEELGFIGAAAVLLIFLLMCYRLLVIAQNAKDDFGSLIAIGVFSMILFQTVINIGMTIGLSPVTGIPLPFLSYGRSALLMNFLAMGIVESVANYRRRLKF
jgi:rod shape determining protein RodA